MGESLRVLTEEIAAVQAMVDDPDMPEEAIRDTLEALEMGFDKKAEAVQSVRMDLEAEADIFDKEIKRLQARKKERQNKADRLKAYLRDSMIAAKKDTVKAPLFTISLVKGRAVLNIHDEEKVPDEYRCWPTDRPPVDKALVQATLVGGGTVPGAEMGETAKSLRVR